MIPKHTECFEVTKHDMILETLQFPKALIRQLENHL